MKKLGALLIGIFIVSIGLQAQDLATFYSNDRLKASYRIQDNGQVLYTKYSTDGKMIERGYYRAMKKVGTWSFYDADGNLRKQDVYQNGEKHGLCVIYSTSGAIVYEIVYQNGERVEAKELDMSGMIVDSRTY